MDLLKCRESFVKMIKDENFEQEPWSRQSIKQHWNGKESGFSCHMLQNRWRDYKAGYKAAGSLST